MRKPTVGVMLVFCISEDLTNMTIPIFWRKLKTKLNKSKIDQNGKCSG